MNVFLPADILIPDVESMEKWSVIACDQFSSQPEYWKDVKETVGDAPSSFHLIFSEAELEEVDENEKIKTIHWNMQSYLEQGIFQKYEKSYVYVERTLKNGSIRRGLIGMIDLEAYDYSENSSSRIRATEKTVTCRIPPRVRIREDAPVELPHILLLCDDRSDGLMKWLSGKIFTTKRWNFLRFIELLQRQMKKHYWMSFKKHVAPRKDIQYNGIRKSAKVFFI